MFNIYVNDKLVKSTSNKYKAYKIALDYRKKAKEEHKTYYVRVQETRELIKDILHY